jgi:hypothetical protein
MDSIVWYNGVWIEVAIKGVTMVKETSKVKRKFTVNEDGNLHSSISKRVTVIERSKDELKTEIENLEKFVKDRKEEIANTKKKCEEQIKDANKLLKAFRKGFNKMKTEQEGVG